MDSPTKRARLAALWGAIIACAMLAGCVQSSQTIRKEDEERYRHPPSQPPAERSMPGGSR